MMNIFRLVFFLVVYCICSCNEDTSTHIDKKNQIDSELNSLVGRYMRGDSSVLELIRDNAELLEDQDEIEIFLDSLLGFVDVEIEKEEYLHSLDLLHLGRKFAIQSDIERLVESYNIHLAWTYFNLDKIDSVEYYISLVEKNSVTGLDNYVKSPYYNTKGLLKEHYEQYLEAIEYYQLALECYNGEGDVNEGSILQNIGHLFLTLKNYHAALKYFLKAKEIFEKRGDKIRATRLYTNLGVVYSKLDSVEQGEFYQKKTLENSERGSIQRARAMTNYANTLRRKGSLAMAKLMLDSSTAICQKNGIEFGVVINQLNYAHVLIDNNEPKKALQILQQVSEHPIVENRTNFTLEIYDLMRQSYDKIGDVPAAYKQMQLYHNLNEKIIKQDQGKLVIEWEESLQRMKSEKELAATKEALDRAKWQKEFFLVVTFLLCILFVVIGFLIHQRKSKKDLQSKLMEEESEILRLKFEVKERELASQSIHLQAIGGFAGGIADKLSELQARLQGDQAQELQQIIREFENGLPEELWDDFRVRFENINNHFYQQLLQIAPDLTAVEIKIASFLRLNLSSKEISRLTNRSPRTIANTRSTLRKKLNLEDDDNLIGFLVAL